MAFKRMTALVAVLLTLFIMSAAQAADISGSELAGTVSRMLTATSDKDSRCVECTMGDAVADAVCRYLGADIAIVCGGDFKKNLLAGDITWDELRSTFSEEQTLATAVVTVRQLREILEVGVSHVQMNEAARIDVPLSVYDGFPQISGFMFYYDLSAPVGQRIYEIYVNDERLDLNDDTRTFTLASTEFMLEGGYGHPCVAQTVPSELTLADVTARYLNDGMGDYNKTGDRIKPMGTVDGVLSGPLLAGIVGVCLLFSLFGKVSGRAKKPEEHVNEMYR